MAANTGSRPAKSSARQWRLALAELSPTATSRAAACDSRRASGATAGGGAGGRETGVDAARDAAGAQQLAGERAQAELGGRVEPRAGADGGGDGDQRELVVFEQHHHHAVVARRLLGPRDLEARRPWRGGRPRRRLMLWRRRWRRWRR